MWFLQRRFHKDILLNPVLVLSFCPDLSASPGHLGTATRELLFLLDGSSTAHKARGAPWGWPRAWVGCLVAGEHGAASSSQGLLFLRMPSFHAHPPLFFSHILWSVWFPDSKGQSHSAAQSQSWSPWHPILSWPEPVSSWLSSPPPPGCHCAGREVPPFSDACQPDCVWEILAATVP